jgi:hypothetical protein
MAFLAVPSLGNADEVDSVDADANANQTNNPSASRGRLIVPVRHTPRKRMCGGARPALRAGWQTRSIC